MTEYYERQHSQMEPWVPELLREIDKALARGKKLNEFEKGFIGTIRVLERRKLGLSTRQASILRKISERLNK